MQGWATAERGTKSSTPPWASQPSPWKAHPISAMQQHTRAHTWPALDATQGGNIKVPAWR